MSKQKQEAKQTKLPIGEVSFQKKNILREKLLIKQTRDQILLVSSDVTHYCVLGYN